MNLKINTDTVLKAMENQNTKLNAALKLYALTAAKSLESDAKRAVKWEQHTGNAKKSISGDVIQGATVTKIVLSGGMAYSIWLEMKHNGRYSVLRPTINSNKTKIINGLSKLL